MEKNMLFGISLTIWIVMLVCAVIAVLYVLIVDKKEGKRAEKRKYLAILMCIAIAVLATVLSKQQAYVGAPMIGLIVGILIVNIVPEGKMSKEFKRGTVFAGKRYLSLGIVFLGATLAFSDLFSAVYALPLVLFNMALAFAVSYLVGRKVLHVSGNTCALVGSGTCVCGGTAIATISPIVKAKEEETAYAMTAIFLFDLLACFMYPYLAIRLGYTPTQFGFLAGTAVNDTSSVVAAQETYAGLMGLEGYALPATIKVVRTAMIIVLALIFSVISIRNEARSAARSDGQHANIGKIMWKALPKFILAFVAMIAVNTILRDNIADTYFYQSLFKPLFTNGYKFFVTIALSGVGFKIKFKELFTKGLKPIALGGCTWLALFLSSLTFASLFAEKMLG